ncbi:MAG: helix-turn-helix domain-containing protein [Verrucomicrobiae bacterium]|nr:helix-turn-helix domain-containing protein [Verrucomicrobiae bacterium]
MESRTLGERIKELRQKANMSLRQLAERIGKSPPFVSDVELGRRYPSEGVLEDIARVLGADATELKKLDTRDSIPLVKRLVEADPRWGLAFRTAAEAGRAGRLTPEEAIRKFQAPGAATNRKKRLGA